MRGTSKTTQTYEALRQDILSGKYPPGARLRIDLLSDSHGVSLGAVREALSRLTSEGLVVSEPQRGFLIAPLSKADLADLTSVRVEIETRCLARSIQIGDVAWEGRVLSALHQMSRTPMQGSGPGINPAWARLHAEFHDALVAACDNQWWLRLRNQLFLQSERYRYLPVPFVRTDRDVDAEHRAIAEAAVARDAEGATEALARHLQRTADILLASDMPFDAPAPAHRASLGAS